MALQCELIKVSGRDALNTYQKLKTKIGVLPIILGDNKDVDAISENMDYVTHSFEQLIEQAQSINPLDWFDKRQAQDADYYDLTAGAWQDLSPANEMTVHLDILSGKPKQDVYIALVPVEQSWMVPAFLKIGDWNDCPNPAEHCAILNYWQTRYGAKIAAITRDVIELEVERPPVTKEQALKLAEQQFIYCPDIVYQGTESIAALASTLLNGKVWFFWWD